MYSKVRMCVLQVGRRELISRGRTCTACVRSSSSLRTSSVALSASCWSLLSFSHWSSVRWCYGRHALVRAAMVAVDVSWCETATPGEGHAVQRPICHLRTTRWWVPRTTVLQERLAPVRQLATMPALRSYWLPTTLFVRRPTMTFCTRMSWQSNKWPLEDDGSLTVFAKSLFDM